LSRLKLGSSPLAATLEKIKKNGNVYRSLTNQKRRCIIMSSFNSRNPLILILLLMVGAVLINGCGGKGGSEQKPSSKEQVSEPVEPSPEVVEETGEQNDAGSGSDVPADLASPYRIEPGTKYSGTVDESDDGDAYTVRYKSGDVVCIKVKPSSGVDVAVMCAEFMANDGVKGEEENLCVGSDIDRSDITRVDIMIGAVSGAGNYNFEVNMTPQSDGNSNGDAGAGDENVVKLEPGTYSDCHLGYGDQTDNYKVDLGPGQTVTVHAIPSSGFDIRLWEWESDSECNSGVKGEEETIVSESERDATESYRFSINTVGESRNPGTYTIKVSVE
jgi:hypothetical protein